MSDRLIQGGGSSKVVIISGEGISMLVDEAVFNQKLDEFVSYVSERLDVLDEHERTCFREIQKHRENYFRGMDRAAYDALLVVGNAFTQRREGVPAGAG